MKKQMRKLILPMAVFFIGAVSYGQSTTDIAEAPAPEMEMENMEMEVFADVEDSKMYTASELIGMDSNISIFKSLLESSGLDTSLKYAEGFTLLIPTNEAFKDLTVAEFLKMTDPSKKAELITVINAHTLPNKVAAVKFEDADIISRDGNDKVITVSSDNNLVTIGGANVLKADVETKDGMIHIVDAIIQPQESSATKY